MPNPLLPSPADFGAPERFSAWRASQGAAFEALIRDRRRFQCLNLATGAGKSLVGITYSLFEDARSVYLTETKVLQDQLGEFGEVGLRDIRGMSNYPCIAEGGQCDTGSCIEGQVCHLREKGCHYYDAVRTGIASRLTSTNYSWWFAFHNADHEFPQPQILICDEAHLVAESMNKYLSVELRDREVEWGPSPETRNHQGWRDWAKVSAGAIRLANARNKWERKKLRELRERISKLARMDDDWVFERVGDRWVFNPLWPTRYLEEWLWRKAPKVILMSATITPKTLQLLGVTDAHYVEYESPIPVRNRPVYFYPTARMAQRTLTDEDLWRWMLGIDRIIEGRLDRNGIIHAVSYERAKYIKENSRFGDIMVIHDSADARQVVELFKRSDPPQILVSPSVHTGHDFIGDSARYQIIAKVPFQPPSALLRARTQQDKEYPYYLAVLGLVQAAGRVVRSPEDFGETFVVDEMASWLMGRYGRFAPRWFRQAWRRVEEIPVPPKLRA